MWNCHRQRGYSLLELIAVLGLIAMFVQTGAGGLGQLISNLKMTTTVNNLAHTLQLGRQVSFATGTDVVLCKSRSLTDCEPDADWTDGWILFDNLDRDHPARLDQRDILRRSGGPATGLRVTANRAAFVMRPFSRRATNGTITVCSKTPGRSGQALIVSFTGKTRIVRQTTGAEAVPCGN